MVNKYLAFNGDDVGTTIGNAIAADDHKALKNTSNSIKRGYRAVEKWIKNYGGKVITSSGDEGLYSVPEQALEGLEQVRADYKKTSGHDLTIGIGDSMSEASKALIYGKLNGKNQIVTYNPHIEDYLSDEDLEEIDEDEALPKDMDEEQVGAEIPDEEVEGEELPPEELLAEEDMAAPAENKHPDEPEHEKDMLPQEELVHDAMENEEDEKDADNIEADEEMGDEGIDGQAEDEELPIQPAEMADEKDMEDNPAKDDYSYNDVLSDMIHGHMEGEDQQPEEEEQPDAEGQDQEMHDELKEDIRTALGIFKQNKDMLEQARQTSPEMYEATVTMLRAMIEMSKMLGYGAEQDMVDQEAQDELVDQFPDANTEEPQPEDEMEMVPEKK